MAGAYSSNGRAEKLSWLGHIAVVEGLRNSWKLQTHRDRDRLSDRSRDR